MICVGGQNFYSEEEVMEVARDSAYRCAEKLQAKYKSLLEERVRHAIHFTVEEMQNEQRKRLLNILWRHTI